MQTRAVDSSAHGAAHWSYRHALPVRIAHWINFGCLVILLMSGLSIFNAHPALHWGHDSFSAPPILQLQAKATPTGLAGVTTVFGREFDTTGVLGLSRGPEGEPVERGFPSWATIPDTQWLAMARRWHLFFAWLFVINGVFYLAYSLGSRHLARDLAPTKADLRGIGRSVVDHLRFRHPAGEAATRYNVLQKLAYLAVIFGLVPLMILTGWAMSPRLDAVIPGWVDIFGGRQSARSLHFLAASALLLFFFVHIFQVVVTGLFNNLRSMITGRYRIEAEHERKQP